MVPFYFSDDSRADRSKKMTTLRRTSPIRTLGGIAVIVFAVCWPVTGSEPVFASNVDDTPVVRNSESAGLNEAAPDLGLDIEDEIQTIHPWDNNDYGDTAIIDDPGLGRHRIDKPTPPPSELDVPDLGKGSSTRPEHGVALLRNFPNPFNAQTRIEFQLEADSPVKLRIYNLLGQTVRETAWARLSAGDHGWTWDGRSERGDVVPSGVYFYQIETDGGSAIHKMVLLK